MANELAVLEKNWLTLADQVGKLPAPFEQTIFLTECHLAGTAEIEDMLVKTQDVDAGTRLVLQRTAKDATDERAVSVRTNGGVLIGYVPRRHAAVMARLMDAGKNLSARSSARSWKGTGWTSRCRSK